MSDPSRAPAGPAVPSDPDPRRWLILAVVVIAQLMVVLDASIVTIALPSAQKALHISVANRQWVITAYTVAFGGLLLLGGRIADFGGRKRMFVVGLVGFAAASALGGLARSTRRMLFGARALQGAFAALMAPAALSILTITFQSDAGERAKAFGAYGAVSGAGGAIGVLAGGILTQYASWRWCLLVNVPIALLAAFAAFRVVHESRAEGTHPLRHPRRPPVHRRPGEPGLRVHQGGDPTGGRHRVTVVLLSVAVVLLVAFVVVEARSSHPLLPLRVVAERNRAGAFLASLLTGAGLFAMFVFLSYYLQEVLGFSALKAGIAFLPFAAGIIVAAAVSTSLVPRLGPRIPMTLGMLVGALGLARLTQIGVHTSYWTHVLPPEILMSLGLGLAFPAFCSTALTRVNDRRRRCGQRPGQHHPAGRGVARHRPPQHGGRHRHRQLHRHQRPGLRQGRCRPRLCRRLRPGGGHARAGGHRERRLRDRAQAGAPDRSRGAGAGRRRLSRPGGGTRAGSTSSAPGSSRARAVGRTRWGRAEPSARVAVGHTPEVQLPPLPDQTLLMVEVGSTAHGTGLPGGEDRDEMGVYVESPAQVPGLGEARPRTVMLRTQPEGQRSGPGDTDRILHPLRRFLRLASQGNPSILMVFWAPVVLATAEGRDLQALGPAFVGRHVIVGYRGYMRSQAERLLGVRGHGHGRPGGRPELVSQFGYDTKYAMHCARMGFQCQELLATGRLSLPIQGEPAEWLRAVRRGEVSFDEWWSRSLELDAALGRLEQDGTIPSGPDLEAIERWSIDTHLRLWGRPSG